MSELMADELIQSKSKKLKNYKNEIKSWKLPFS